MKRPLRFMFAVAASVAMWLGAATPGQACCGFFAALFGHHHAPVYPAYYGPPAGPCCAPAPPCCAPVAFRPASCCPSPCGPCGPLGCPTGACDVGLAPPGMEPLPDGGAPFGSGAPMGGATPLGARPRTFVDEPPMSSPMEQPPADEGFRPRGSGAADDYDSPPADSFGPNEGEDRESLRVVPQRDPPPSVPAETATDPESEIKLRLPAFDLGDKITWRQPPERTRLIQRASFSTPVVARTRMNPNQGWLPAPQDTQLVRK
jgi:hypothetical protein